MFDGSTESLGEDLAFSIGGANGKGGMIGLLGAAAGIAGGIAGSIGLVTAVNGAIQAFAPPQQ